MNITEALEHSQPGLLVRVNQAMQKHQFNQRTEQTYLHWITRFVLFSGLKSADALESDDQQRFLDYLKDRIRVSRARLNQAHQALEFFYQDVLEKRQMSTAVA